MYSAAAIKAFADSNTLIRTIIPSPLHAHMLQVWPSILLMRAKSMSLHLLLKSWQDRNSTLETRMAITNSTLLSERMAVERLRNWVRMEIHMVPNDTTIDGRQELHFAA